MRRDGFPAYTTSVGWLGYSDEEVRKRCHAAVAAGWSHMKMKVGADPADDVGRAGLIRDSPIRIATGEHCHNRGVRDPGVPSRYSFPDGPVWRERHTAVL